MKYTTGIFLLPILLVCGMCACKKKDRTKHLDADLRKHFSYKEGTYYIYRDSVSGREDSFVMKKAYSGTEEAGFDKDPNYVYEYEIMHFVSQNDSNTYFDLTLSENYLNFFYTTTSYMPGYAHLYQSPAPPIGIFYSGDKNAANSVTDVLPAFSLHGNTHTNVSVVSYHEPAQGINSDVFYINDDAGIIKMHIDNVYKQKTLELQRYKIVR